MLTPSVRSCSMLAAALVASVAFTAAPAFAQAGKPAPATPQAALDALEAAIAAGDARAAMALITPDGPEAPGQGAVMGSLAHAGVHGSGRPEPDGPEADPRGARAKKKAYAEAKTAITAALKPSGLDAAIGKPLMPAKEIVDAEDRRRPTRSTVVPAHDGRRDQGGAGVRHEGEAAADEGRPVHRPQGGRRSRDGEVGPADDEDRQDRRQVADRRPAARARAWPVAR